MYSNGSVLIVLLKYKTNRRNVNSNSLGKWSLSMIVSMRLMQTALLPNLDVMDQCLDNKFPDKQSKKQRIKCVALPLKLVLGSKPYLPTFKLQLYGIPSSMCCTPK